MRNLKGGGVECLWIVGRNTAYSSSLPAGFHSLLSFSKKEKEKKQQKKKRIMLPLKINARVLAAEYAVRGAIVIRAGEIENEIKAGSTKYPFKKLIYCNIGNPQSLQQKPLTYNRQVMSLIDAPHMLSDAKFTSALAKDFVARAKFMVEKIGPTATGAYTHSQGYAFVREAVCEFINNRDRAGFPSCPNADPSCIFLTDGASTGVKHLLQLLLESPSDALMIPIPQYPLYTTTIALLGGSPAPYYMCEEKGWSMEVAELEKSYAESIAAGKTPRGIAVINPGNPTGTVLPENVIADIIKFAHRKKLVIMADEVYQENVYLDGLQFHSFRKVMYKLGGAIAKETRLASFHSTSKGIIGECGRRGGYMELINFPQDAVEQIYKLASINLCSNVNGQVMTHLMVAPPKPGEESYESYQKEYDTIFQSLKRRAIRLVQDLNAIPGMKTQSISGAMYAFPQITLPKSFIAEVQAANAKKEPSKRPQPDAVWAMRLVEKTGIVVVPGSGFGQKAGTWHFRTTILPPEQDMADVASRMRGFQEGLIKEYPM